MNLNIFITEKNITTLGPYTRYGLWVQGCHRNCKGCVAGQSHDPNLGKWVNTGALSWEIAVSEAEGMTISGGEPFLQATALADLIRRVKAIKDMGVIVYTGFLYEELESLEGARDLLSVIDLLIDGPYVQELDDGMSLRGSSNQRVIPLTNRYVDQLHLYGSEERVTETFVHSHLVNVVGIPNRVSPLREYEKRKELKNE